MTDDLPATAHESGQLASRDGVSRAEFLAFVEREHPLVVRFLIRCGWGLDDARDATQEAFLEAWRVFHRWHTITNHRAWLRRVAIHAARRPPGYARMQPPTIIVEAVPDLPEPYESSVELAESTIDVLNALRRLPPAQRVAMACHMDGISAVDIAAGLGVTPRQVTNLIGQARVRIMTALEGYSIGAEDCR